jgi:hypothetical protein
VSRVTHVDIRFAGSSADDLAELAADFEALEATGALPEDAALRRKGAAFGPGVMGCVTAALYAYREIYRRAKKEGRL